MPLQETRERLHYEEARKSARGARCSVCHVPIPETDTRVYVIDTHRHTRTCAACAEGKD